MYFIFFSSLFSWLFSILLSYLLRKLWWMQEMACKRMNVLIAIKKLVTFFLFWLFITLRSVLFCSLLICFTFPKHIILSRCFIERRLLFPPSRINLYSVAFTSLRSTKVPGRIKHANLFIIVNMHSSKFIQVCAHFFLHYSWRFFCVLVQVMVGLCQRQWQYLGFLFH